MVVVGPCFTCFRVEGGGRNRRGNITRRVMVDEEKKVGSFPVPALSISFSSPSLNSLI
jgi:hypothetical protein